ncbi:metallo-beta-lactamase superfamily protein [Colletotrichum tofieldiae]|nr:metallo-beta-lactamase superfamily protein [Colletotrichum tofieldiae]
MGPAIKGFERWHGVGYAFLVTHKDPEGSERRIVFDLGLPKDWENDFSPPVIEAGKGLGAIMTAEKYVSEILTENGVDLGVSKHCSGASLIVGPGVKQAYFPGWPAVLDAPVLAREFQGREVRELDFSTADLEIGGLKALDYFGDGSFYLLSAPGHAVGHVNALARTSGTASSTSRATRSTTAPCYDRTPQGPRAGGRRRGRDCVPYDPETPEGETLLALDVREARETLAAVKRFDASPDVFVVAAHDDSLHGVMEYFPKGANEWKRKGWKESGKWLFLKDLEKPLKVAGVSV